MKTKKVRYIGHVIKDVGFWQANDLVKFTPTQYKRGFKAKRSNSSDWLILKTNNVKFIAKETTLVTKNITEELI